MKPIMARVYHDHFLLVLEDELGIRTFSLLDAEFNVIGQYKHLIDAMKKAKSLYKERTAKQLMAEASQLETEE